MSEGPMEMRIDPNAMDIVLMSYVDARVPVVNPYEYNPETKTLRLSQRVYSKELLNRIEYLIPRDGEATVYEFGSSSPIAVKHVEYLPSVKQSEASIVDKFKHGLRKIVEAYEKFSLSEFYKELKEQI